MSLITASLWCAVTAPLITEMAPVPDELFAPLRGDPRELHFALRYIFLHSDITAAEVAIGHYYGIYRWALPNKMGAVQLDIGGGIFPHFNFSKNKDLQVIDFYANVPLDIRMNKWSGRLMLFHVSSHLGDDYIRTSGQIADSNSWNSIKTLLSYDVNQAMRLYSGYIYHLQAHPPEQKLRAYQSGFEINFNIFGSNQAKAYWANDLQWWERTDFKPQINSQFGIKRSKTSKQMRAIYYFLEYSSGPEYFGQFYNRLESRMTIGINFDIN